jgi:uncharacterized protein with PIN domain
MKYSSSRSLPNHRLRKPKRPNCFAFFENKNIQILWTRKKSPNTILRHSDENRNLGNSTGSGPRRLSRTQSGIRQGDAGERFLPMRYWLAPHLAFLVQWLRILGLDVRLWNKSRNKRVFLGQEEETVVQWDRYPLPIPNIRIKKITLSSTSRETLLKEFIEAIGFQPGQDRMFRRCLRCNSLLIGLSPEEAKSKWPDLPVYVFQTQRRFNWCETCHQLFWAGTHVRNMIRTLEEWGIINTSD